MATSDAEALCRGVLLNAAARQVALAKVDPERPSVDYLTGFGAGWEAGQVSALAFALSVMTGESPTDLVNEALARAAVDSAFPFDLHIEAADEGAA
jgi:hypothetical protein